MPNTVLLLDDIATHLLGRQWTAVPTAQDISAGNSVDVTINQTTTGASPPGAPTTLELKCQDANGTVIRTFALVVGSATQTVTFWFTHDGTNTGTPRKGTIELNIHAQRSTGGGTYDLESDGAPSTPPTGSHVHTVTRGWIRGTTDQTEDISNVGLGSAPVSPATYDESLFVRLTDGVSSYIARVLTVSLSAGALSGDTNSSSGVTHDITFANVCDDRFPAAVTTVGVTVVVPNATFTGQPDWAYSSVTEDTLDVDPRLTLTWHLQLNDPVFGTAKPTSREINGAEDTGSMWVRYTNARGTGINLTTERRTKTDPFGTTVNSSNGAVTTQDGQAGWSARFAWDDTKPAGTWTFTSTIILPNDIELPAYLINPSPNFTLLASNSDLQVFSSLGPLQSVPLDHWSPGQPLLIGAALFDTNERDLVTPNTSTGKEPSISIGRFALDGTVEYLEDDLVTWADLPLDGSGSTDRILLTRADLFDGNGDTTPDLPTADSRVYLLLLTNTTAFSHTTVFALVVFHDIDGNRYAEHFSLDPVGSSNLHSANMFDPTGLFK